MKSGAVAHAPLAILVLCSNGLMAQHARESWKPKAFGETPYSLADAPLTIRERRQIYRIIHDAIVRDLAADAQADAQMIDSAR
jgi:hypothetical protein